MTAHQVAEIVAKRGSEGEGGLVLVTGAGARRRRHEPSTRRHLEAAAVVVDRRGFPRRRTRRARLIAELAARGLRTFVIAGDAATAAAAATQGIDGSCTVAPGIEHRLDELTALSDAVRAADPHVVLIGLPFPRHAELARWLADDVPRACFVGV